MVLDAVVLFALFLAIVFSAGAAEIPGAGRLAVVALLALILFYEPILVSRSGATLGHRWSNLHVVSERTGGHPPFGTAFLRFLVKSVLGIPSFILMALTRQHQALHDRIAGTTVRIADLTRARNHDIAWERSETELAPPGIPSRVRRIIAITLHVVLSFVVLVVLSAALVSPDCLTEEVCTEAEDLRMEIAGIAWLAVVAVCIIVGWRGHLLGARKRGGAVSAPGA